MSKSLCAFRKLAVPAATIRCTAKCWRIDADERKSQILHLRRTEATAAKAALEARCFGWQDLAIGQACYG
jgi:hypothetical protein